jgi:hypothetical protein
MATILSDEKKQQALARGQLGWSPRKIEAATGIRRETAGKYLRPASSIAIRAPRQEQVRLPSKPATACGMSSDSDPSKTLGANLPGVQGTGG